MNDDDTPFEEQVRQHLADMQNAYDVLFGGKEKAPSAEIPPEHKLPCDFIVGRTRFRKGVALETVRKAAERWHRAAQSSIRVVHVERPPFIIDGE